MMRLGFLALLLLSAADAEAKRSLRCLPSGDHVPINEAFANGGKGTTVALCPGSVHRLNASIHFTAAQQTLTTLGQPKGRDRALLVVEGPQMATAIYADCKQCSQATISNLIIDGNRPQLLRVPRGEALIETGNAYDQKVTGCRLFEPRGWSALHVREGDELNCRRAYIADNEIGPCGEEWDDEYDGLVEKDPPYGNPRADGISVACRESVVERNVVFDATDGAIVLFGSAGTEVRQNDIYSRTRVVLGGINLVDYDPWEGDYAAVRVHHNRLWALGRYFKVGIVAGPSSWSDDTDTVVHGATVDANTFNGPHFGYGIVVSSAEEFTVINNKIAEDAAFSGVPGPSCPTAPENGSPAAFLLHRSSAQGTFQPEFENGEVQHIICVEPPEVNGVPYKPWRMRDSPEAVAAAAAKSREIGAELEGLLAEALVGYQGTLAAALHAIEARMDNLTHGAEGAGGGAGAAGGAERAPPAAGAERDSGGRQDGQEGAGAGALASVMERLASLERSNAKLASELEMVGREVAALVTRAASQADAERPILQDVYNRVKKSADAHTEGEGQQAEGKQPGKTVGDRLPVEGLHLPFIGGAVVLTLVLLLAHMWYRRMPSRKVKV